MFHHRSHWVLTDLQQVGFISLYVRWTGTFPRRLFNAPAVLLSRVPSSHDNCAFRCDGPTYCLLSSLGVKLGETEGAH